jgi:hypothetical protein
VKRTVAWRGLLIMVLIGIAAGIANTLFYLAVTRPLVDHHKLDEVAINTYVVNFFVGWLFFSAWFLARGDEEFKKVGEAVVRGDREGFLVEAPKKLPTTIRVLYLIISIMSIIGFHLFPIENPLVTFEVQFGVAFFVVMAMLVLFDIDEPIGGVISVHNVPAEWLEALRAGV